MIGNAQNVWEKYPAALPSDTILAGKYIIREVLGQGGFGITYLAEDYKTKEKVAVKEYFPETMVMRSNSSLEIRTYTDERSETFLFGMELFLEEAKVLAQFQGNEHIVGVRQYFEENSTAYFVMDYIEGINFKTFIKQKGGKIPWEDVQRIMLPIMEALNSVHKKGLVHRDVTPDNIIIANDGTVKLLDFGSARYSLGDRSRSLDVVLKPGYAPKEQYVRRGKQGPYTDVYSVAACFYAALSGYLPPESLERMEEDNLVPLSARGVHLPKKAEDAILKALEVRAEDRFQSMEDFRLAINGEIPSQEIDNRNHTVNNETDQSRNKRRKIFVAACAVLCIAAGTFLGREIGIFLGKDLSRKQNVIVSDQYNNNLEYDTKTDHENKEYESQKETEHIEAEYSRNILMEDNVIYTNEYLGSFLGMRIEPDKWVLGKEGLARRTIVSITFLDTLHDIPDDAWDVSQEQNGLVMAWVEPFEYKPTMYHLYIAADGGIQAASGKTLFACYRNVTKINFNHCFHTDQVTDMSYMFGGCRSLANLDLSGFDTDNVTDTSYMFDGCTNLANLVLNDFDTGRVTDMSHMFDYCSSLESLDLSHFDTSYVTNMQSMFGWCSNLTHLDVSGFDTSNVTNMSSMFNNCENLSCLDLSGFNTKKAENAGNVSDMFQGAGINAGDTGIKFSSGFYYFS